MATRRRPRGVVAGRPRFRYLFREQATFYELTLHLEQKIKQQLRRIDTQLLDLPTEEAVANLVEQYALHVPVLDRDHITESDPVQVQMEVPAHTQNRAFFGPGPHFVAATAITINVPFHGDANLLLYSASGFGGNYIDAQMTDNSIVMTHKSEHPDATVIKKDFDARMMQIENALQFIREQAKQFNDRLPHLVRPEVIKQQAILQRNSNLTLGYGKTPVPAPPVASSAQPSPPAVKETFDVFLSHASEDKSAIARPLYEALRAAGVTVWFDEAVLKMGDSLSGKIDEGLARCAHGIVIISPSFLAKRWPKKELSGLIAREMIGGKKVILPIWHDIDEATLVQHAPTLVDKVAGRSTDGVAALTKMILEVIRY